MQKELADKIIKAVLIAGEKLDEVGSLARQIDDEAERKKFRRHVGETMATLNADVLIPIIQQHPDLDPDK
jgi:hypothetical protein